MPNSISPATGLQNTNFVANTSRYINSDIIYWGENNIITFATYKRQPQVFSAQDKYMFINGGLEYRPDLIAKKAYGTPLISFWWKIMEANNIWDVFDLKAGLTLRIPPISQ